MKIIKLEEPKNGFVIDKEFADELVARLDKTKQPELGEVISQAIGLFLEKNKIKEKKIII